MTWFNDVFVPAAGTYAVIDIGAAIFAAVFHNAKQATSAVKDARRWLWFRAARCLHRIPDPGEPLDRDERRAFAHARRDCRRPSAAEPESQQQEDWF